MIVYMSTVAPLASVAALARGIAGRIVSGDRNFGMFAPGSVGVANAEADLVRAHVAPTGISMPALTPALYARKRLLENLFICSLHHPLETGHARVPRGSSGCRLAVSAGPLPSTRGPARLCNAHYLPPAVSPH